MVGCFCLSAVVTAFKENGLVAGAKEVTSEQGAICAPFLKDYAKANAIKILAVSLFRSCLTIVVALCSSLPPK